MGALLRWREPAVLVLLVVLLLQELLAVALGVALLAGGAVGPYGIATYAAAGEAGEPVTVVLLAVLVVSCRATPIAERSRSLTTWALVAVAAAVPVRLLVVVGGSWLVGAGDSQPLLGALGVVESLLGLAPLLIALATLTVLVRHPASALVAQQPVLPTTRATAAIEHAAPEADPALQPTWRPDAATGAVWLSAGDAASGRPPTTGAPVGDADEPHPWASGPR